MKTLFRATMMSIILVMLASVFLVDRICAFNNQTTHRFLTRAAVALFDEDRSDPTHAAIYIELSNYLQQIEDGSDFEDEPFLRSVNHFFNPNHSNWIWKSGALDPTNKCNDISSFQYMTSFDYATSDIPNDALCDVTPQIAPLTTNCYDWYDALRLYRSGDEAGAYLALGHILHLLQDCGSPAHTHLVTHGSVSVANVFENVDPIETFQEIKEVSTFNNYAATASKVYKPNGANIREKLFDIWQSLALKTFGSVGANYYSDWYEQGTSASDPNGHYKLCNAIDKGMTNGNKRSICGQIIPATIENGAALLKLFYSQANGSQQSNANISINAVYCESGRRSFPVIKMSEYRNTNLHIAVNNNSNEDIGANIRILATDITGSSNLHNQVERDYERALPQGASNLMLPLANLIGDDWFTLAEFGGYRFSGRRIRFNIIINESIKDSVDMIFDPWKVPEWAWNQFEVHYSGQANDPSFWKQSNISRIRGDADNLKQAGFNTILLGEYYKANPEGISISRDLFGLPGAIGFAYNRSSGGFTFPDVSYLTPPDGVDSAEIRTVVSELAAKGFKIIGYTDPGVISKSSIGKGTYELAHVQTDLENNPVPFKLLETMNMDMFWQCLTGTQCGAPIPSSDPVHDAICAIIAGGCVADLATNPFDANPLCGLTKDCFETYLRAAMNAMGKPPYLSERAAYVPNFSSSAYKQAIASDLAEVVDRYGFDGLLLDDMGRIFEGMRPPSFLSDFENIVLAKLKEYNPSNDLIPEPSFSLPWPDLLNNLRIVEETGSSPLYSNFISRVNRSSISDVSNYIRAVIKNHSEDKTIISSDYYSFFYSQGGQPFSEDVFNSDKIPCFNPDWAIMMDRAQRASGKPFRTDAMQSGFLLSLPGVSQGYQSKLYPMNMSLTWSQGGYIQFGSEDVLNNISTFQKYNSFRDSLKRLFIPGQEIDASTARRIYHPIFDPIPNLSSIATIGGNGIKIGYGLDKIVPVIYEQIINGGKQTRFTIFLTNTYDKSEELAIALNPERFDNSSVESIKSFSDINQFQNLSHQDLTNISINLNTFCVIEIIAKISDNLSYLDLSLPSPSPEPTLPSVPSGLQANPGDGSVTAKWASNPISENVTRYNVYRSGNQNTGFTQIGHTLPPTTLYYDPNLTNGTPYYYRATAVNSVGEGDPSATVSATPQAVVTNCIVLQNPVVNPRSGDPTTEFEVGITYGSTCNRPPTSVNAVIDGNIRRELLRPDYPPASNYYRAFPYFSPGSHTIYFEASDGISTTQTSPPITISVGAAPNAYLYFSNLQLSNLYYSPNGDGVKDAVNISYTLSGSFTRLGRIEIYNQADQLVATPDSWGWRQPGNYSANIPTALPDGAYKVKAWGTNFGTFIQSHNSPDSWVGFDIALGPDGNIYVLVAGIRIDVFNSNLQYMRSIGGAPNQSTGIFEYAFGLHVDGSGNIYVTEAGRDRVVKLNSSGTVLGYYSSSGFGPGQVYLPGDVVTDELGNIYVLDNGGNRIEKFGPGGNYLGQTSGIDFKFGSQFEFHKVIYDGNGHLYVSGLNRVIRLNQNLQYEREYNTTTVNDAPINPSAICIDKDGNLIVASSSGSNQQALKFDPDTGVLLDHFYGYGYAMGGGTGFNHSNGMIALPTGEILTAFGEGASGTMRKFANSNPRVAASAILICDLIKPTVDLTFPTSADILTGTVPISGSANDINFESYSLFYRPESQSSRTLISTSNISVNNGQLGTWDAGSLASGNYYLILSATDKAGNANADSVLVNVSGGGMTPPSGTAYFSGTGHWYQVVPLSSPTCWETCRDAAVSMGGYLATITSAAENDFIMSLNPPGLHVAWIGGSDAEQEGVWKWVTGEVFYNNGTCNGYCNWGPGEPSGGGEGEDYMELWVPAHPKSGFWNDGAQCDGNNASFIVEYDHDPNHQTSNAFCENFDDGTGWQSRWTAFYGDIPATPTIVTSPTHNGSSQALAFQSCWPAIYRNSFNASEGVYSGWVYQTNTAQQGAQFMIQADYDGSNWLGSRNYSFEFSCAGTPGGGTMVISRRENDAATDVTPFKAVQFGRNEWTKIFIIRKQNMIIAGYERTNGFRDSVMYVDPAPLTTPGKFIIMSCGLNASNAYIWDDICYDPQLPEISNEAFCDNFEDGNIYQQRWETIYGRQVLVNSPVRPGSNGTIKYEGYDYGCHSVMRRMNFQAGAGEYNCWFRQDRNPSTGLRMQAQVQPGAERHPDLRNCYVVAVNASNSINGGFLYIGRLNYPSGQHIQNQKISNFVTGEWIRVFMQIYPNGRVVGGYERNGVTETIEITDPSPLIAPGDFYVSSCVDGSAQPNYVDDICYAPAAVAPNPEISLTNPNGGELLNGGEIYPIEWTASNLSQGKILIYIDAGSGWQIIHATSDLNARRFDWIIPRISAGSVSMFIGVWDGSRWLATDMANAPFSIAQTQAPLVWKTSGNITDCNGPVDINSNAWTNINFNDLSWQNVTLPDAAWGCDMCDRYYRLGLLNILPGTIVKGYVKSDDAMWLYANGREVGRWAGDCHVGGCVNDPYGVCYLNTSVPMIDLTPYLRFGNNAITAHVSQESGHSYYDFQVVQTRFPHQLVFLGLSPINLQVQSPSGSIFKKGQVLPEGVFYYEADFDGDGDLEDEIIIQNPEVGNYQVSVTPESGASPTETYSLAAIQHDITSYLARNIQVNSIPSSPYLFASTALPPDVAKTEVIPSTWYFSWLSSTTGTVRYRIGNLPTGYDASKIVASSIRLNGYLPVYGAARVLSSAAGFSGNVLEVAFNRVEALRSIENPVPSQKRTVCLTGNFNDGKKFVSYYSVSICQDPNSSCVIAKENAMENEVAIPNDFMLFPNYPNPFNPSTEIEYGLPIASDVNLTIYNILGQKVKTLVDEPMPAGYHIAKWDGRNESGVPAATGIYLYRIQAGDYVESKKMLLLK